MSTKEFPKDRGWSWLVLAASFCTQVIVFGLVLCFGIYFVTLMEETGEAKSSVALVGSLAYGTMCVTGLWASLLCGRWGCRPVVMLGGVVSALGCLLSAFAQGLPHLYVSYGLINGVGLGLAFTPSVAVLPDHFHKHRFFATAFASVGSAVGTLLFQPLFLRLIEEYTWRGSMLINAGVALHICLFGALLKSRPPSSPPAPLTWRRLLRPHLFRRPKFLLLLANGVCWGGAIYVTFSLANALVLSRGLGREESALLVSVLGGCNVLGRVAASVVGNFGAVDRPLLYTAATLLFSLAIVAASFAQSFFAFALTLGLFGAMFGGMLSQLPGVLMELFGVANLADTLGCTMAAIPSQLQRFVTVVEVGTGGLLLPMAGGWAADAWGMPAAFRLAGGVGVVAFGAAAAAVVLHRTRDTPPPALELSSLPRSDDPQSTTETRLLSDQEP